MYHTFNYPARKCLATNPSGNKQKKEKVQFDFMKTTE